MDSKQFKEAAISSVDEVIKYLENVEERRVVSDVEPGYLRKLLPAEAPQEGEPWEAIQRDVEDKILPGMTHWQSPNFFAFFPCATSYPSILGELYSAAFSGAFFNWICGPAVTELETIVLDWLAKAVGLPGCYLSTGPTQGGGVIQGSASEAVVAAMVGARDKYLRETLDPALTSDEDREEAMIQRRTRLVALASSMSHSGTKKAAVILGVRYRDVPVRAEDGYAMTGAGLARTIAECRAKGLEPFYLTATLGTTDTCAVDDMAGIAATLAEHAPADKPGEIWVHVDAAYAGAALVCPEVQAEQAAALAASERFHSFNFNLHKWLLTNFDASALWVRDRRWLVTALAAHLHVYENSFSTGGLVTDYRDWQVPLGRRFRALKMWFVLRTYGLAGLQAHIRRGIGLGVRFAELVKARPDLFEIVAGPSFALVVFRVVDVGGSGKNEGEAQAEAEKEVEARRNTLTRRLYEAINASGKLWVTSTVLDGQFTIRFQTATRATEQRHVNEAFEVIVATTEKIMQEERGRKQASA